MEQRQFDFIVKHANKKEMKYIFDKTDQEIIKMINVRLRKTKLKKIINE